MGNRSGVYIIPIGVQIETKKHPRAGSVGAGINIKKLTNIIESQLDQSIRFMLIDKKEGRFVFSSYESAKYSEKIFHGFPQSTGNENYIYKQEMEVRYPYDILVGYDSEDFWREVGYSSLLFATQIIGVVACILYMQRKLGQK